jgi:hypothetical protein
MDTHTLRSRIVELMQRSRKAMRLYATMGRNQSGRSGASAEFSELQAEEWKSVNADLVKNLGAALDEPHPRKVVYAVLAVGERLCAEFRRLEAEVHLAQRDLIHAAENGDFVKAAVCSRQLVISKARLQATEAAQHELETVIKKTRIALDPIELDEQTAVKQEAPAAAPAVQHPITTSLQRVGAGGAARAVTTTLEPDSSGPAKVIPLKRR